MDFSKKELDLLQTDLNEKNYKTALDNVFNAVLITNHKHEIIYANKSFLEKSLYNFSDIKSQKPTVFHFTINNNRIDEIENAMNSLSDFETDIWFRYKYGKFTLQSLKIMKVMNEMGSYFNYVYLYTDILDTSQRTLKDVPSSSYVDQLTQLPNRLFLESLFDLTKELISTPNDTFAILYMEIELFHLINEEYGFNFGNRVIKTLSELWNKEIPSSSTLIRWEGVGFVVLIDDVKSKDDVKKVANNILSTVEKPFQVNGITIKINLNIGISMYINDGIELTELLTKANKAMISSQKAKLRYQFYDQSQKGLYNQLFIRRLEIEKAINNNEFEIFYQPIVSLHTKDIVGLEALIRWNHPEDGLIPPNRFIPLAEQTGLIISMGEWIFNQVSTDIEHWEKRGYRINVSVNVSMKQFNDPHLVGKVKSVLEQRTVDPSLITLELTESVVIHEIDETAAKLKQLKSFDLNIAIDDFGTGYSSLGYIIDFPIDRIKIDRSFIKIIEKSNKVEALVSAIIMMGEKMDIDIVAEGIETNKQLEFLRELQCKIGQGFLFDKPMALRDIEHRWLA